MNNERAVQSNKRESTRPKNNGRTSTPNNRIPQQYATAQQPWQEQQIDMVDQEDIGYLDTFLAQDEESSSDESSYNVSAYHISSYIDETPDVTSRCFNMLHMEDDKHMAIMDGGGWHLRYWEGMKNHRPTPNTKS